MRKPQPKKPKIPHCYTDQQASVYPRLSVEIAQATKAAQAFVHPRVMMGLQGMDVIQKELEALPSPLDKENPKSSGFSPIVRSPSGDVTFVATRLSVSPHTGDLGLAVFIDESPILPSTPGFGAYWAVLNNDLGNLTIEFMGTVVRDFLQLAQNPGRYLLSASKRLQKWEGLHGVQEEEGTN